MSDAVIKVEDLSKQYRLGQVGRRSLSNDLNRWWHSIRGKEDPYLKIGEENDRTLKGNSEYVWALKNINFEVKQGDVLGIIGRNGAGKSTLLKILSKVTAPTTGTVKTKGRIASLLEVGTGFHPDLSGRDNIFLNGAILGMTRKEIQSKFDEIVDFAGVERYIDTPVKRYSSGMYVRLAFGVAAHLEPEILIVDEVLAVGDAEFQKKCLGKMKDVSVNHGRTVLFVSHNMSAIAQLCTKSILIGNGLVELEDQTSAVIDFYLNRNAKDFGSIEKKIDRINNQFSLIQIGDKLNSIKTEFRFDEPVFIRVEMFLGQYSNTLELAMRLVDKFNRAVFTIHEKLQPFIEEDKTSKVVIAIPAKFITPGSYSWVMCINDPKSRYYDLHENILSFKIIDTGSEFARYDGLEYGCIFPQYEINKY